MTTHEAPKRITLENCSEMVSELANLLKNGEDVYFDLRNTETIDANCLPILLHAFKTFRDKNYDFRIINQDPYDEVIYSGVGLQSLILISKKDKMELGIEVKSNTKGKRRLR